MNEPWTSKDVWNLLDEGGGQMVADAHNAELAAELERIDEWKGRYEQATYDSYDCFQKLVAAQAALEEIRAAGYTLTRQGGTNVIDDALAKVKEGRV